MKLKTPSGIIGGILKYGPNPTAIFHVGALAFMMWDKERMRKKRIRREQRAAQKDGAS